MKTVTYDIVIDRISSVGGSCVDVHFHREIDGVRDGFEIRRINVDEFSPVNVVAQVMAKIGATETVELED